MDIGIIIIGSVLILAYLGRNSEDENIKGFFTLVSLVSLVAAVNVARTIAVHDTLSTNVINSIWVLEWTFVVITIFSLFYTIYKLIVSIMEKYKRAAMGEDMDDEE